MKVLRSEKQNVKTYNMYRLLYYLDKLCNRIMSNLSMYISNYRVYFMICSSVNICAEKSLIGMTLPVGLTLELLERNGAISSLFVAN